MGFLIACGGGNSQDNGNNAGPEANSDPTGDSGPAVVHNWEPADFTHFYEVGPGRDFEDPNEVPYPVQKPGNCLLKWRTTCPFTSMSSISNMNSDRSTIPWPSVHSSVFSNRRKGRDQMCPRRPVPARYGVKIDGPAGAVKRCRRKIVVRPGRLLNGTGFYACDPALDFFALMQRIRLR